MIASLIRVAQLPKPSWESKYSYGTSKDKKILKLLSLAKV